MEFDRVKPYGAWESPITADLIVSSTRNLDSVMLDGEDTYWLEGRPAEGGRSVIVRRRADGHLEDVLPAPYSARSRVHEYGGGAYTLAAGIVYFVNFDDQRVYRLEPGEAPEPISPGDGLRYADLVYDRPRGRLLAVREDHTAGDEPTNTLVALGLEGEEAGTVLLSGNDFYSSARLSPDGRRLAWLTWNHPHMPWDAAELWAASVRPDGSLGPAEYVAGGPGESAVQPEWSPAGELYFAFERGGWWKLYRQRDGRLEQLTDLEAEFSAPLWTFGQHYFDFVAPETIFCAFSHDGLWGLGLLETETGRLQELELPYTYIRHVRAAPGRAVFVAASPTSFLSVVEFDLGSRGLSVLRRANDLQLDADYVSAPEMIAFPTGDGRAAYANFYPPKSEEFEGPEDERPPLVVMSHGGPTANSPAMLNLYIQYLTTRGLAVVDVNYGGSSGYGREYRERLRGRWGLVDVEDCINAARYLVETGRADGGRLAIRGGSAGGYTTLCALTFHDVFQAGASYFGVSDLEGLARDTHKFESRYLDALVAPYPEQVEVYRERSPIHFADQFSAGLIAFQGLEDKVVPPAQSEMMVAAVRRLGLPLAYLAFEGEYHGFRKAETIKRALEAELYFYGRLFGFEPADYVEPVAIENLEPPG
ncbi:MAG: S9 family peptidase [Candidatus Promineifilaceae bacterium]